MREMSGIDIVTRLHDLTDLPYLDRLIFSVMAQTEAGPLRLHVMLQRFSSAEVQSVREATRELRGLREGVSVLLHNWNYAAPFDLRVPLLNWGLEVAQGRYFTCCDVHDQLYQHACTTLLTRLRDTTAAVALGGVAVRSVWWWGDVVLPLPDQRSARNNAALFMVDRDRLSVRDCVFRNSERDSEVDEFISRLRMTYDVDATCEGDVFALRDCPRNDTAFGDRPPPA